MKQRYGHHCHGTGAAACGSEEQGLQQLWEHSAFLWGHSCAFVCLQQLWEHSAFAHSGSLILFPDPFLFLMTSQGHDQAIPGVEKKTAPIDSVENSEIWGYYGNGNITVILQ